MTSNDKNLVERFCRGDDNAFDELYRLMHQRVYRFALPITGNAQDAEDVAVQTFVEAYKSRTSFRGNSRLETWLFRIAVHTAIKILRSKRHEPFPSGDFSDKSAESNLHLVELNEMLQSLPEKLRIAFFLVKVEGMTHREAAEVLGQRQGTVQAHVFRASRLLRSQLLDEPPPDE